MQARDALGNPETSGTETFMLIVEKQCTMLDQYYCRPDNSLNAITGLPIVKQMEYDSVLNDGTYSAPFTISGTSGTISVSVDLV